MRIFFIFLALIVPAVCFSQVRISGRILNQADTRPVSNASVFISNATIGDKSADDGTFTLRNLSPGKYDLVISIIGFEAYDQIITVGYDNIKLTDIIIFPKSTMLKQVVIKPHDDPDRDKYFELFKTAFIGTSDFAEDCKILNPQVLDFDFDKEKNTLKASSYDFLEIQNADLGYKIKYLLADFSLDNDNKTLFYRGSVLFEELKGSRAQVERWQNRRQQIYEGSEMHFLRSVLANRLDDEGFRAQQLAVRLNQERPADDIINAKIDYYKKLKNKTDTQRDSLTYWIKKSKLPKSFALLMPYALNKSDLVKKTNQRGQYALGCELDGLYVAYSKTHHFNIINNPEYLNRPSNRDITLIKFNEPYAFFYSNGVIVNPYSVILNGVWARAGIAELLPVNYMAPQSADMIVDSSVVKNVTSKLKAYAENHVTEKTYLHFDKPYYAAGDTIYFKAYLTQGANHQRSSLSGVLHDDLLNTDNKVDKSINLKVVDGVAWGDFALADSLPQGNYRVRAYTRWMNNDPDNYFSKTFPIGSIVAKKTPEAFTTAKTINAPDLQFFPEGGKLVAGINCKIAFKAIDGNGLGIDVRGEIVDNENKAVTSFTSQHLGMGYFYLNPSEGKSYKAKITFADGSNSVIDLPVAESKGIILSVKDDSKSSISITIRTNEVYFHENSKKSYPLVIYSGGVSSSYICKLDSEAVTIDVLKQNLQTGTTQVTLFSPEGDPLCERLIFVQNNDMLKIGIGTNKAIYNKREKVNLTLNVKNSLFNAASGHFSVSVTDESKVKIDENSENTILTDLLLTSDLKGYVEQPNYYFSTITDKTNAELDLVMLTHGYRQFEWQPLLNNQYPLPTQQPEKSIEIAGIVNTFEGKRVSNGNVTLLPLDGGDFFKQNTDANGKFNFEVKGFLDSGRFVLKATNSNGDTRTRVIYNKNMLPEPKANIILSSPQITTSSLYSHQTPGNNIKDEGQRQTELLKSGKGKLLKEVKITGRKIEKIESNPLYGAPDQVINGDQISFGGQLGPKLFGRLNGVQIVYTVDKDLRHYYKPVLMRPSALPVLVVVNGEKMEPDFDLNEINTDEIKTIQVFTNPSVAGLNYEGAIYITTKFDKQANSSGSEGVLPITVIGYYKAREFYSPKYDHPANGFDGKDLRSTIYWKPDLITDKDGNATFSYYNSDGTGSFRVVIEGIDENGNLGRQVYKYKVE